jgi:hypothetical protein
MPRSTSWWPPSWATLWCCALLGVAAGCTEKPGGPVGPDTGEPVPQPGVSYSANIAPLFTRYGCISCHGNSGNSGYSVRSYELVFVPGMQARSRGLLPIKAGDPDSSYMVWKLSGGGPQGEPITGVKMPQSGGTMSAADLALLKSWIADGAPDN